jgi:hypothetical protein
MVDWRIVIIPVSGVLHLDHCVIGMFTVAAVLHLQQRLYLSSCESVVSNCVTSFTQALPLLHPCGSRSHALHPSLRQSSEHITRELYGPFCSCLYVCVHIVAAVLFPGRVMLLQKLVCAACCPGRLCQSPYEVNLKHVEGKSFLA